jgi:hypothetical protein
MCTTGTIGHMKEPAGLMTSSDAKLCRLATRVPSCIAERQSIQDQAGWVLKACAMCIDVLHLSVTEVTHDAVLGIPSEFN